MNDMPTYIPETWTVPKDVIYAAKISIKNGLEYARECVYRENMTYKNRIWLDTMKKDILQMEKTLEVLNSL
jgi:hypothetical protein